jgi:uncharacterized protein YdhG (YjbR/CyaY superfamily)
MARVAEVEQYLSALPAEPRTALESLRATIAAAAPDATETISYGMPAFKHNGRPLVAYAAFKHHCSLFPMSTKVIEAFAEELEPFRTSKGTLQFQTDRPLPAELVTKLVEARIEEIEARGQR